MGSSYYCQRKEHGTLFIAVRGIIGLAYEVSGGEETELRRSAVSRNKLTCISSNDLDSNFVDSERDIRTSKDWKVSGFCAAQKVDGPQEPGGAKAQSK